MNVDGRLKERGERNINDKKDEKKCGNQSYNLQFYSSFLSIWLQRVLIRVGKSFYMY